MRTKKLASVLSSIALPVAVSQAGSAEEGGKLYLIGGVIALLILGYLIYSLLKPDKF
jgi:K+-transporting ATPase KdpF subunit